MILCVGLSPAWDVTYRVAALVPGASHRVDPLPRRAGGKAANVARVLAQLDEPAHVVVPAGGPDRGAYAADLAEAGVPATLTTCREPIRTSVTVSDPQHATVLNEPAPALSADDGASLSGAVRGLLATASAMVVSGSVPSDLPSGTLAGLVRLAHDGSVPVVLDCGATPLGDSLSEAPELVKPNADELSRLVDLPVGDRESAFEGAGRLRAAGAGTVVVSLGSDGLVSLSESGTVAVRLPDPVSGNPTGAGDALTAVLAVGLTTARPWAETLAWGAAVAAAAVSRPQAGETDVRLARELLPSIVTEERSWAW